MFNGTFVIHKNYELAISLDEVNTLQGQGHDWMEILAAIHLVTRANKSTQMEKHYNYCMHDCFSNIG